MRASTGAERKGCAHTHRGKHREPENQRHSKHGICEGAGSQRNNAHAANHDRVRPSHEHLTDVARNDWRSQRERTAVFGKGSGKKRHEMRTEAKGGKRRRRNRRSLMPGSNPPTIRSTRLRSFKMELDTVDRTGRITRQRASRSQPAGSRLEAIFKPAAARKLNPDSCFFDPAVAFSVQDQENRRRWLAGSLFC